MAMRTVMLKSAGESVRFTQGFRRWAHVAALPPPLVGSMSIQQPTASPTFVLPEIDRSSETNHNDFGFGFPSFPSDGAMDLMAVPKRKTSRHKRGIRNGPKALKPIPVIIRCKGCGRVKLPHFFCCSGDRGNTDSTS